LGLISPKLRLEATKKLLFELGIDLNPKANIEDLSVAMMQLVEIVRAVSYNSDILIMDEPTSALSEAEIKLLYSIMHKLSDKGVSTIFISHKLEEIFEVADRVTILRDGKLVGIECIENINQDQLIKMIVGRQLTEMFPKEDAEIKDVVLEVKNLRRSGVYEDISFSVREGEILGFCGLMGAGRTEIMNGIFGIDKINGGEIFYNGEKIVIKSPRDAIKKGIGMLTEDRLRLGAIHFLSIGHNLSLANLYKICKMGFINRAREIADCKKTVLDLQIKIGALNDLIGSLSGGNQQKLLFGRSLLINPKVLILDEPTRGIDVGSKSEIHRLCSALVQKGMAIIMVSSELPEILGMSDRIHVIRDGRIVGEYNRGEVDQETLIKKAFGV
jgi:ABC-type sugar transport system ATPase subunit